MVTRDYLIKRYNSRDDVPPFSGSDEYLQIITDNSFNYERWAREINGTGGVRAGGVPSIPPTPIPFVDNRQVIQTIVKRDRIPTIERLYLENIEMFGNIVSPIIRPSFELTRADLDTQKGRRQLFNWLGTPTKTSCVARFLNLYYSFMFNDCQTWDKYMLPMAAMIKTALNNGGILEGWEHPSSKMVVAGIEAQPYMVLLFAELPADIKSNGLFEYESATNTHMFPTFWTFHPDIVMEIAKGEPITGRDEFERLCQKVFPPRYQSPLMGRYDAMQRFMDGYFATYMLFKHESFDAIADLPTWQQHVALQNYFATFKYYTQADRLPDSQLPTMRGGERYQRKAGYRYEGVAYKGRLKYIVSEVMNDVLHAPANLRPYANGQKRIVIGTTAKPQKAVKLASGKQAYPREPNEQIVAYALRKRTPDLFNALVGTAESKNRILQEIKANGFSEEQIFSVCRPEPEQQKFHDYMMGAIQRSPDFNHVKWGRMVADALNATNPDEELLTLSNQFACTIDLKDCALFLFNRNSGLHPNELSAAANLLFSQKATPLLLRNSDTKKFGLFAAIKKFHPMAAFLPFSVEGFTDPNPSGGFDLALVNGEYVFNTVRYDNMRVRVTFSPLLFYGMDGQHIPHTDEWFNHVKKLGMRDNWSRTTLRVLEIYKIQAFRTAKHEYLQGKKGKYRNANNTEFATVKQTMGCSIVEMYEFVSNVLAMTPQAIPDIETISGKQKSRWVGYIERELMNAAQDGVHITKFERDDVRKQYCFYWRKQQAVEQPTQ